MILWATGARIPTTRRVIAGAVLALWLGTMAILVLPQLHRLLHADADGLNHHCLITQLQKHHSAEASGSSAVLVLPVLVPCAPGKLEVFLPSPADYLLCLSRGPPVLISSSAA